MTVLESGSRIKISIRRSSVMTDMNFNAAAASSLLSDCSSSSLFFFLIIVSDDDDDDFPSPSWRLFFLFFASDAFDSDSPSRLFFQLSLVSDFSPPSSLESCNLFFLSLSDCLLSSPSWTLFFQSSRSFMMNMINLLLQVYVYIYI